MTDRGLAHGPATARREDSRRAATAAGPPLPRRPRRAGTLVLSAIGLAAMLFLTGSLGVLGGGRLRPRDATPSASPARAFGLPPSGAGALASRISVLQGRLRDVPQDHLAWASLGLAYVEQARVTVNPSYYPKAEGALERSLAIEPSDNYGASAGMSALAAARHDFFLARDWAQRGLAVNPASALLNGLLGDSQTQLGNYPEAFEAIQRMVNLAPDTASLARVSYSWELRGDLGQAGANMQRALDDAATPADRAFSRYYLGELAFHAGDPSAALAQYDAGLAADPTYARLLEGRARAQAALGRFDDAVATYRLAVDRLPEPASVVQFGELLQSLGRLDEAAEQYRLFATQAALFESNGVTLDVDHVLFEADHGDAAAALRHAEQAILTRPFLDTDDAYAWALHVNGRDTEALAWSEKALALGTRSALFHYHAGLIKDSVGDVAGARADLATALRINPQFSPLGAPLARQALERLGGRP